jgi:putative Mn2+ efflux pump MntP
MYEHKSQSLLPRRRFIGRMLLHLAVSLLLMALSLGLGIWGYAHYENLSALDGFLNAAMLLGGMGPIHSPVTEAGKLFAGCYALYAGLVFIVLVALILTPVLHRVLHRFHWGDKR